MELTIEHVGKRYGQKSVLDDVSCNVVPGEILALVGPNGSGKSTLIKILANLLDASSGTVHIGDRNLLEFEPSDLARIIGYVPQYFSFTTYSTVLETVLIGRRAHIGWSVSEEELQIVQQAMDTLGISQYAGSYIDELSGGERQRVFIARAVAQDPSIFLFDEPTSSLDIRHQLEVLDIMRQITREKKSSLIIAVHDLNLALRFADKVLILSKGRVQGYGTPEEVLVPDTIRNVYGVNMLEVKTSDGTYLVPLTAVRDA